MIMDPQKVITFPQKVTLPTQLVNISLKINVHPKICWFTDFLLIVASRIYALCVVKSTNVPKLGANFGNARLWWHLFLRYIPYSYSSVLSGSCFSCCSFLVPVWVTVPDSVPVHVPVSIQIPDPAPVPIVIPDPVLVPFAVWVPFAVTDPVPDPASLSICDMLRRL